MNENIVVGITFQNVVFDLKIPTKVTVSRLKELLREALSLLGVTLPKNFEIIIQNKPIQMGSDALLSNYYLGDGDQLLIIDRTREVLS